MAVSDENKRRRHGDNLSIEVWKLRGEDLTAARNKEGALSTLTLTQLTYFTFIFFMKKRDLSLCSPPNLVGLYQIQSLLLTFFQLLNLDL